MADNIAQEYRVRWGGRWGGRERCVWGGEVFPTQTNGEVPLNVPFNNIAKEYRVRWGGGGGGHERTLDPPFPSLTDRA